MKPAHHHESHQQESEHKKNVQKGIERMERHSGTGNRGDPKKGGGGGKHTWGEVGAEFEPVAAALDKNDPNYDPDAGEEQLEERFTEPLEKLEPKKVVMD
ncbi:hypothetical protein CLOM_g9150 [Closterium sp. NIES-68]|nr:hypothetical protein CLOM_g9150 [Closterium sp. NIES-68]GJP62137.1 hypothetical protein CLOP_g19230 [Closterium sp. NIES-67]